MGLTTARIFEHKYLTRGGAVDLMRARDAEVLLSGPAGTGKSRACLEKIHLLCRRAPDLRVLVCRKTLVSLAPAALKTYREKVASVDLALGWVYFHGGGPQDSPQYRYLDPVTGREHSTITVAGLDKPSKIMSTEFDVIYVQEATELDITDWEFLLTRLRNWRIPFQQLIADCNPDTPTHWLKQRCDQGRTKMLYSRHEDNPVLFDAEGKATEQGAVYLDKLDNLTGVRYKRLRKGLWVAAEGMVYEEWDDAQHLTDPMHPPEEVAEDEPDRPTAWVPPEWPRFWSVDFGYTNPFVLQCWAVDPDGRMYLYREIYRTKRLVEDHATDILNIVAPVDEETGKRVWLEPKPQAVVCDHDAEGRETLRRHLRLPMRNANKDVLNGIEAVQKRLRPAGDGKPRLFLTRHCIVRRDPLLEDVKKPTCTQEEVAGYVWDPSSKTDTEKEQPLKENDHGMDALRYAVAYQDLGGGIGVRSL